jgi:hypothetical protein
MCLFVDQAPKMQTWGLHLLLVMASALSAAGCDLYALTPQAYSFRSNGEEHLLAYQPVNDWEQVLPDGGVEAHRLLTLTDEAAQDFGCPANDVRVNELAPKKDLGVFLARGCDHASAYLLVTRTDKTLHAKGQEGTLIAIITDRFIELNVDDPARSVGIIQRPADMVYEGEPNYSSPGWSQTTRAGNYDPSIRGLAQYIGNWSELISDGARDLDCPRASILPYFKFAGSKAADWPIAEGCGKRATYLPGRMPPYQISAIAPIK